jgi:hypothetical protein
MANAFGKIAKTAETKTSKSTVKVAAEVNTEIRNAVDLVIAHKAEIARLEAEQAEKEQTIIEHVRPQMDKKAYAGEFTKSMIVEGNNGGLTLTCTDKFSVPQTEKELEEIKKVTGKLFGELFEEKNTISLKENVTKDEVLLNKIASACEKAGMPIADIFDNTVKTKTKTGFDEKVYQLPKDKLEVLRTLIKQNKPGLR